MTELRTLVERDMDRAGSPSYTFEDLSRRRERKRRTQRLATTALALVVAAAGIAGVVRAWSGGDLVPADRSADPFVGTWESVDLDGSSQIMEIRATGEGAYEIGVHDESAGVCSGTPSTMTGLGRLQGAAELLIPSPVLTCDDGSEPEALSGPPLQEQLRNLTFVHDPATDTLTASFGVVWSRTGGEEPTPLPTAEEPPSDPGVGETVLRLRGDVEVGIYADGRVIWEIGDGDPGYLQMRLTPEGVERLRSTAVSTGLFEQEQGLTLDHGDGTIEVRRGDRSVIIVWGEDPSIIRSWTKSLDRDLERTSAATAEQEIELVELVAFFRDPTAWALPRRMYVQPEPSPFVPARILVVYDHGAPDWSKLPSPAREVVSANLQRLIPDGCQVISTDQAREIARGLTQAGIDTDYDSQRGLLSFSGGGSFVHSIPALPHEVDCETRWPGLY
ncbi:MAG TPA: hypothetical protein VFA00_08550 [Actinomycetota bacterium]|jgi:hypothetical protein|nr:hypothetical protein [Actinomycetota bacterium]